jgi:hypothetical protein
MLTRFAVVSAAFALGLAAQSMQTMRANIRGGDGDRGKCTIEVEVDGAADVEVRGDTGRIRTLQGQPATWRRFECNSVMPRNPVDFRFRGIDGRGNVQLIQSADRTGVAVVRIEDPKGGREGYTFDLEWRGGAYANDPYYDRERRNDPLYDRGRRNDPLYDRGRRNDPLYDNDRNGGRWSDSTVAACEDAVRARARQEYGVRNPRFTTSNVQDLRGNRDRVTGSFRDPRGEYYDYSCTVQENNGRIRSVDVRRQ